MGVIGTFVFHFYGRCCFLFLCLCTNCLKSYSIVVYPYFHFRWYRLERFDAQREKWVTAASLDSHRRSPRTFLLYSLSLSLSLSLSRLEAMPMICPINNWSSLFFFPSSGLSVAVMSNLMFAIGGWDGSNRLKCVDCFVPAGISPPPSSSLCISVVVMRKVVVADIYRLLMTIEIFEKPLSRLRSSRLLSENTWSEVTVMRTPRSGHALAVLKPYIYVIGGTSVAKPLASGISRRTWKQWR